MTSILYLSVEALVVSIGEVDEITLPENAIELTASVHSQTEPGILIFISFPSRNQR